LSYTPPRAWLALIRENLNDRLRVSKIKKLGSRRPELLIKLTKLREPGSFEPGSQQLIPHQFWRTHETNLIGFTALPGLDTEKMLKFRKKIVRVEKKYSRTQDLETPKPGP